MSSIVGIPSELLFSALGFLFLVVFKQEKEFVREKLKEYQALILKINSESKELSKEEFNEVKSYVKEAIKSEINSREFKEDIKQLIKDTLISCEKHRVNNDMQIFSHFSDQLNQILKKIDK
jgi:hypothetical protein